MSRGRVLVIDDDEWVCRLLAVAMKESGFEITITENAAEGFYKAVEEQPDCIVCDVDLPDHNGYWVAKKIRAHPSRIANAPFVFLSGLDDREHRLEGFQVGGDAYLTKPFRIDEVVAQVDALIQMAARLNKARISRASIPPPEVAMHGDLAQMSLGTLLTLLDLERRSGILLLKSEGKTAEFNLLAGGLASTTLDGVSAPALETTRKAMSWVSGKFAFTPVDDRSAGVDPRKARMSLSGEEHGTSINALLMEAARLEDEERNEEGGKATPRHAAAWKETLARHTPRPFAAVTGALPDSANIFTSRPPPSSGRGPPPALDSIMAPPALSESDVATYEPPGVVAKPEPGTVEASPPAAPAAPAVVSPSPQGIAATVPLPRFPVRPAAGTPASSAPPAPTFGPAPVVPPPAAPPAPTFGPAPSTAVPAPTFGPAPVAPPQAPTPGEVPPHAASSVANTPPASPVASRISPTPAVPNAPISAPAPSPAGPPPSVPGAIPAPPLASRFQGGRTPTLSGATPRPPMGAPPVPAAPPVGSAPPAPAKLPAPTGGSGSQIPPAPAPNVPQAKPPLPGPRTAFGARLRSLSPSRPMVAVQPSASPAPPSKPPIAPADVDAGWSNPPSAPPPSSSSEAEPLSLDDLFENEIPPSKGGS